MSDFDVVREALRWHEYGSQDERRAKALPALDRIEAENAELDRLRRRFHQVSDERIRLEAENARLREALERIRDEAERGWDWSASAGQPPWQSTIARSALSTKE